MSIGDTPASSKQEELCTIGDEPLHEAGEGIEDTRCLARIEAVLLRDLTGYLARGEDSDRIVCCAEVGHRDEDGDSQLSPALATDAPREVPEEVIDTAVVADELEHTTRHQRHDDQLAHARDTTAEGGYPVPGG